MSIETYGTGKRMELVARKLTSSACKHLVVLPVPSTKDKRHITNTDLLIDDSLINVSRGTKIVGYGLPIEYVEKAETLGATVYDVEKDEIFLLRNAKLTAIGALGYILSTSDREPSELSVGVFGYGRIGSILVRMLLFMGARTVVYTSKLLKRVELGAYGIETASVVSLPQEACDFSGIDILVNTAPKDMKGYFENSALPLGLRVIELASGDNFAGIDKVERLPGIPGKMYPISAAEAYVEAIERLALSEGEK